MAEQDEHLLGGPAAAQPKDDDEPDFTAPPGERETWQWLSKLADDAAKGRTDQADDESWDDDRQIYWGEQWDTDLPSFKLPIVVNELKTMILSEVSDLT